MRFFFSNSRILAVTIRKQITLGNQLSRIKNRLRNQPHIRPIGDYPSSIVDSEGCEFGYEMFYHLPYAYHLAQQGLLERTISCKGTQCFYFFSPDHREVYNTRHFVKYHSSIAQVPHARPDFNRWTSPDFASHYKNRVAFRFEKTPLLIFNKFNVEWDHPPINFFSIQFLKEVIRQLRDHYTIIYLRPTAHIVHDHMPIGDMNEKALLRDEGATLVEDLYADYGQIPFNEFQLCLLSHSPFRISIQGGGAYMNALFPGKLMVLHRYGGEQIHGNYADFPQLGVDDFSVHNNEFEMLEIIRDTNHAARDVAQRRAS